MQTTDTRLHYWNVTAIVQWWNHGPHRFMGRLQLGNHKKVLNAVLFSALSISAGRLTVSSSVLVDAEFAR
jgi:hypothetical protein